MWSNETSPNEPGPASPPDSSRGTVIYLLITLTALAAFVGALRPGRPNVKPAPLRPQAAVRPRLEGQFTPTNFTDLPGLELASLSKERRNHALLRLNMEPCPCGCNTSLACCLVNHAHCGKCKELAQEIVAEERFVARASRPLSRAHGAPAGTGAGRSRESGRDAHAASEGEAAMRPRR